MIEPGSNKQLLVISDRLFEIKKTPKFSVDAMDIGGVLFFDSLFLRESRMSIQFRTVR